MRHGPEEGDGSAQRGRSLISTIALFMHATLFSDGAHDYCESSDHVLYMWTAGHRAKKSMKFEWWANKRNSFAKYPMHYSRWDIGSPNDRGGHQNCVYMYWDYTWTDSSCRTKCCFICESRNE